MLKFPSTFIIGLAATIAHAGLALAPTRGARFSGKLGRRQVVERAVWTFLLVVNPPCLDLFPGIPDMGEPVLIQALVAEFTVEAFDTSVPGRIPRNGLSRAFSRLRVELP